MDIYQGFINDKDHHSYGHLILPSESTTVADVMTGHSTTSSGPGTTMSSIMADAYVPSVITNIKDSNPLSSGSNTKAFHYMLRQNAANVIGRNKSITKEEKDTLKINGPDSGALWHDGSAGFTGPKDQRIPASSLDEVIRSIHSLPALGVSRPDYGTENDSRLMAPDEYQMFHAAHREHPSSDIDHMIMHDPDFGFTPNLSQNYLGSAVPHGLIHVRHTIAGDSHNRSNTVHHYLYDPTMETLNHAVSKGAD
jgi:hypothetical protein